MKGMKPILREDRDALSGDMPAPEWMSENARDEWRRVLPLLVDRRILTGADLASLENYCVSVGRVREVQAMIGGVGDNADAFAKLCRIQDKAMATARLLAAELGLTPVSRSRPTIRDDGDSDELLLPFFDNHPGGRLC
jgi:P27 family predicted phage terminase small subunit